MTRIIPALAMLALLAACGADGAPIPPAKPSPNTTAQSGTGVSFSGYGRFGAVSGDRAPGGGGDGGGNSGGGY